MRMPDDPIIRCIERTGYPPWFREGRGDDVSDEEGRDEP